MPQLLHAAHLAAVLRFADVDLRDPLVTVSNGVHFTLLELFGDRLPRSAVLGHALEQDVVLRRRPRHGMLVLHGTFLGRG